MITVNERAEECTVKLSVTFVNPSMVSAYNELTSEERTLGDLTAALSAMLMQICAFMSEPGGSDTN